MKISMKLKFPEGQDFTGSLSFWRGPVFEWCEGEIHPLVAEVRVLTATANVAIRVVPVVLA